MSTTPKEPPVLPAYAFRQGWWVWCDHCAQLHCHGDAPGHRVAHCKEVSSPYRHTGYILKFAGRVTSLREARPGRAPLHGFLERTRAALPERRHRLLKAWLPEGHWTRSPMPLVPELFLASVREDTPDELFIEVDLNACTWTVAGSDFSKQGKGLHTLAESLFGVPADIAARRIAETIGDDYLPAGDGDPNTAA